MTEGRILIMGVAHRCGHRAIQTSDGNMKILDIHATDDEIQIGGYLELSLDEAVALVGAVSAGIGHLARRQIEKAKNEK